MLNIPIFASENEYCAHRANIDFWWPYIIEILQRHHIAGSERRAIVKCGDNPTYPVFLIDDIVIKFSVTARIGVMHIHRSPLHMNI